MCGTTGNGDYNDDDDDDGGDDDDDDDDDDHRHPWNKVEKRFVAGRSYPPRLKNDGKWQEVESRLRS